jgi:hypothetical protein
VAFPINNIDPLSKSVEAADDDDDDAVFDVESVNSLVMPTNVI